MDNFNLRNFLIENRLTTKSRLLNENYSEEEELDGLDLEDGPDPEDMYGDVTVSHGERKPYRSTMKEEDQELTDSADEGMNVNKYLSMEGAEAIVKELEKDSAKAYMEAKLNTLKEVISTLEGKCNSLEESEDAAFISQSKLKEMKTTVKKLRKMEEKMVKEYEKKYPAKKSLKENTSKSVDYQVELLVPTVFYDVDSGELADSPYAFATKDEIESGEADITHYVDGDELDEWIFSNDYDTAKYFAERYPNLIRIN